jgi:hypothetical protein
LITPLDTLGMPIVVRRGRPVAEPRSRLLRFERPSTVDAAATAIGASAAEPDERHELARLALDLVVRTAEPIDAPQRWLTPAFAAEVDRTRAQLAPIRTRDALLASFRREASISATRGNMLDGRPAGPVRVAYAIRWLELGDGRGRPVWASILAGAARDLTSASLALAPAHRNGETTT